MFDVLDKSYVLVNYFMFIFIKIVTCIPTTIDNMLTILCNKILRKYVIIATLPQNREAYV